MSLPASRRMLLNAALAIVFAVFLCPSIMVAQDKTADAEREQLTADRFLQVLLKRPRPGTALDQVYGFHVRNGSLNELLIALQTPGSEAAININLRNADPGASIMVLGLLQLHRGKSVAAVKALKQAEALRTNDAVCSFYLGKAHLSVGETELAVAAIERAIKRRPQRNDALPIFTELGRIYGRAGAAKKALDVWTRLEQLFPDDSRVSGRIAATLAEDGNLKEAQKRFAALAKSARKDDDRIAFAIQATVMKRRLGKSEEATQDLETILSQLRPGSWLHTDVLNRIEDGFLKSGEVDALADYYQERLNRDTDNLELMTRLSRILVSSGRLEDARETLTNAVERAPNDVKIRLTLIDVLVRQAQVSEAAEQYAQLAKQDPSNPDYLLKWGQLLLDDRETELADRRESAAKIWQRLAEARSQDAVTLALVADRMRSIERSDEAIALYREASERDPTASQYREYLGEYLHQLNRKDEAILVWESIAEGDRRNAETLIRLAEIYRTFKLPKRSLDTWKAASEFDFTFYQELRYASRLRAAKQFDAALERLRIADGIADTPDERDQLMTGRITTYSEAGTLPQRIEALQAVNAPAVNQLRELALMHQAAGQLAEASVTITAALHQAPENTAALSLAADILERQNRLLDAAAYYRQLANADRRFQTKYLEKVAQLQIRLGQAKQALQTCDELIQANPASIDTYVFAARAAFQLGRSEKGIEVLRRAMSVARRDNRPRLLLASEFAAQYRTGDAIDLYWQAIEFEGKVDNRIDIIRSLIPLYQRQGETQKLLSRIEAFGALDQDIQATQLMLAAANEALKNYDSAKRAIERLLSRQPRDLSLLEAMVRLNTFSNDPATAAEFQRKIVSVADTAENRFRLLSLQFDAGTIDAATMMSQRIELADDPASLMKMIEGAVRQPDSETAILIARQALRKNNSLWDVKLMLAWLLLGENSSDALAEAETLCSEILALKLPPETPAPTSLSRSGSANPLAANKAIDWNSRLSSVIADVSPAAARFSPSPPTRGFGSGLVARRRTILAMGNPNALKVGSYGEAWIAAIGIDWRIRSRKIDVSNRKSWLLSEVENSHALPKDLQQVTDAWEIIKYQTLSKLAFSFGQQPGPHVFLTQNANVTYQLVPIGNGNSTSTILLQPPSFPSSSKAVTAPSISPVAWRLFELSPADGWAQISAYCLQRFIHHHRIQQANSQAGKPIPDSTQLVPNQPLTEAQLLLLAAHFDQLVAHQKVSATNSFYQVYSLASQLQYEFQLAENEKATAHYASHMDLSKASYQELRYAVNFHASVRDLDSIDTLIPRMTTALREEIAFNADRRKPVSIGSALPVNFYMPADFLHKHRLELLGNQISLGSYHQSIASKNRVSVGPMLSTGSTASSGQIAYRYSYPSQPVATGRLIPFSAVLFDANLVNQLRSLYPEVFPVEASSQSRINARSIAQRSSRKSEFRIEQLIDALNKPFKDVPEYEVKSRRSLAAFIWFWNKAPDKCYELLQQLSKDFPNDAAIRIELARIAQLIQKDSEAIAILDKIKSLDLQLRQKRDLMILNSAIKLSDREYLTEVANRLADMQLNLLTALDVSEKLSQHDLTSQAIEILKAAPRGVGARSYQDIQIADRLYSLGDKKTSAEIASSLLKQLARLPPATMSRTPYGLSRAVGILQATDQLNPLIEEARQKVAAAPNSEQAIERLFRLYEVVGLTKELAGFQNELAAQSISLSVSSQINFGKRLLAAGEYAGAGDLLLMACKAEPTRVSHLDSELQTVARAGYREQVLEGLKAIPLNQIPDTLTKDLLEVNQRLNSKTFTYADLNATERAFIVHLVNSKKDVSWALRLMNTLPQQERTQLPEFRAAVLNVISHARLFQTDSQVWNLKLTNANRQPVSIMEQLLTLSRSDPEARKILVKRITSVSADAESIQTAGFLKAVLALLIAVDTGQSRETIDLACGDLKSILNQVQVPEPITTQDTESLNQKPRFSQPFLRQAARIVESTSGIPSKLDLLHAMFEVCPLHVDSRTTSFDNTILPTMLQAYRHAGQIERAVDRLMAADQQTSDVSEMGSSQTLWDNHLKRKLWIAEELLETGAVFEALAICREELGDKVRLAASGKLNRGETPRRLRALETKTTDRVTPEAARLFLQRIYQQMEASNSTASSFDLIMSPATAFRTKESLPIFLLAVKQAATTEQGQEQLASLDQIFEESAAAFHIPSAAIGARLTIACVLNSDQVANLSQRYRECLDRLPVSNTHGSPGVAGDVRNSLAVLAALSLCEQDQATQAFDIIKTATANQVHQQQDFESALVLSGRFGHEATLIDGHIAQPDQSPERQLQATQMLSEILQHAFSTAAVGQMQASTRAFSLALSNQPAGFDRWRPAAAEESMAQSAKLRVTIHHHQKLKTQIQELIRRVLLTYESQCRVVDAESMSSQQEASPESITEWRNLTVDALQQIIFDKDDPTMYHLHAKEIAPAVGRNMQGINFTKNGFELPVSVSQTLVRIAASCERLHELNDRIKGDSIEAAILRIQIAREQGNSQQLVQRLNEFQRLIAADLTRLIDQPQQSSAKRGPLAALSPEMKTSSHRLAEQQMLDEQSAMKSEMVNQILHATWAISLSETEVEAGKRSEAQQIADQLLRQADSVIESDTNTADRLSRISRIIQNQLKANAAKN